MSNIVPLRPAALALQAHSYRQFNATVPSEVTRETLTDPALWPNLAKALGPGDEIRALAEDLSWRAHLLVLYKQGSQLGLKVIAFDHFEEAGQTAEPKSDYEVVWRGPSYKYCIIDPAGDYVKKGFASKADAYSALDQHTQALAS